MRRNSGDSPAVKVCHPMSRRRGLTSVLWVWWGMSPSWAYTVLFKLPEWKQRKLSRVYCIWCYSALRCNVLKVCGAGFCFLTYSVIKWCSGVSVAPLRLTNEASPAAGTAWLCYSGAGQLCWILRVWFPVGSCYQSQYKTLVANFRIKEHPYPLLCGLCFRLYFDCWA